MGDLRDLEAAAALLLVSFLPRFVPHGVYGWRGLFQQAPGLFNLPRLSIGLHAIADGVAMLLPPVRMVDHRHGRAGHD